MGHRDKLLAFPHLTIESSYKVFAARFIGIDIDNSQVSVVIFRCLDSYLFYGYAKFFQGFPDSASLVPGGNPRRLRCIIDS